MKKSLRTLWMIGCVVLSLLMQSAYAQKNLAVLSGIDRLFTPEYATLIQGKKIAIVANSASLNREEKSTVELLKQHPRTQVVALFSPEHGFSVSEDDKVLDDGSAKIPIYSLYGPRKSPAAEQLAGVDCIVFDLETVGLRYYTYITTLALVMKAAKEHNIPIIVLDRVNPLGGERVMGALLNEKYVGDFAGYYPIPTRYGLTMGELARFYNRYFGIKADLAVVPLKNWRRDALFTDTDLKWHAPSPALPTFEQAFLYSIFGPYESLQLAVGRSQNNTEAFRRFGAPWITEKEASELVTQLNKLHLPGLAFQAVSWTPNRAKYQNQRCNGFMIKINALKEVDSLRSFIKVSHSMHQQFKNKLRFSGMDGMIGSSEFRRAIEDQLPPDEIIETLKAEISGFMQQRESILLY